MKNHELQGDQSFDAIADKFDHNIYGTGKGRLRHELLVHYLQSKLDLSAPLTVLDAGGGTGVMTEYFARQGQAVTLNDMSEDCLRLARQRLAEFEQVEYISGPIQSLHTSGPVKKYDLIICHAVLEWLQDPMAMLDKLHSLVKPGGHLSVSFFNKKAQIFGNLLYGNFDYVAADLKIKNRVRLSPNNALDPEVVLNYMEGMQGGKLIHKAGLRCIHDYMKERDLLRSDYADIFNAEITFGQQVPYMWLGKYFHVILQKQAES